MKTDIYTDKPDIFDSRDFIERMEELRSELDALVSDMQNAENGEDKAAATEALESWLGLASGSLDVDDIESFTGTTEQVKEWGRSDDAEELAAMEAFAADASGVADWTHGETFIREDYFEDYARQLADDLGSLRETDWPHNHIDWKAAADELRQDYSEFDFDGTAYYARG